MNIIRYLLSAVSVMVCLSGCIWEDRSDCTCDVILSFIYTGDGDTDIFPEKIDKVNMYVYSADGYSLEGCGAKLPAAPSGGIFYHELCIKGDAQKKRRMPWERCCGESSCRG